MHPFSTGVWGLKRTLASCKAIRASLRELSKSYLSWVNFLRDCLLSVVTASSTPLNFFFLVWLVLALLEALPLPAALDADALLAKDTPWSEKQNPGPYYQNISEWLDDYKLVQSESYIACARATTWIVLHHSLEQIISFGFNLLRLLLRWCFLSSCCEFHRDGLVLQCLVMSDHLFSLRLDWQAMCNLK